jgi:hypothetical protein
MIPGLPQDLLQGSDEEGSLRMKRMIYITDSMTAQELDSDGTLFMEFGKDGKPVDVTWRVLRVAKGSGTSVREVEELLCQYRMMANMAKQAGGKNGWYVFYGDLGVCYLLGCLFHSLSPTPFSKDASHSEDASCSRWPWARCERHANPCADPGNAGESSQPSFNSILQPSP